MYKDNCLVSNNLTFNFQSSFKQNSPITHILYTLFTPFEVRKFLLSVYDSRAQNMQNYMESYKNMKLLRSLCSRLAREWLVLNDVKANFIIEANILFLFVWDMILQHFNNLLETEELHFLWNHFNCD